MGGNMGPAANMGSGNMGASAVGVGGVSPQILQQLGIEGNVTTQVFVANVSTFPCKLFMVINTLDCVIVVIFVMLL